MANELATRTQINNHIRIFFYGDEQDMRKIYSEKNLAEQRLRKYRYYWTQQYMNYGQLLAEHGLDKNYYYLDPDKLFYNDLSGWEYPHLKQHTFSEHGLAFRIRDYKAFLFFIKENLNLFLPDRYKGKRLYFKRSMCAIEFEEQVSAYLLMEYPNHPLLTMVAKYLQKFSPITGGVDLDVYVEGWAKKLLKESWTQDKNAKPINTSTN